MTPYDVFDQQEQRNERDEDFDAIERGVTQYRDWYADFFERMRGGAGNSGYVAILDIARHVSGLDAA